MRRWAVVRWIASGRSERVISDRPHNLSAGALRSEGTRKTDGTVNGGRSESFASR